MRVYVVYDFWKEVDDGVRYDRAAMEINLQELTGHDIPNQGRIEFIPSIIPLASQIMKANNFSKVVILNIIPLPVAGMAEQPKIITPSPGLFKP